MYNAINMKKELTQNSKILEQIKTIMNNPSFKVPQEDKDFFYSDDARGIRLQLDYLKSEVKLREEGIDYTIPVFGSARITEESGENSFYYDEARKLGQLIGNSGNSPLDCHVTLMTGGGPGIMEAANRGAFDVGAKSIGLNIKLPREQFPNPYITPDLCFQFQYFAIRKLHFMQRAKALVVFPGGFGTLDELFGVLTLMQTKKTPSIPIVLVGKNYWKNVINFEFLIQESVISSSDLDLLTYTDTAKEAWKSILAWHEKNKTPLF